jgi:DNA replication protein DnaC
MNGDVEKHISHLRYVRILVLDDLGVERPTPLVLESLYRIIDTRADEGLRTIVTSNGKPSALAATLGARIHSRLLGMCKVIHIDGPDGRLT